jgi:hypothetical protein
MALGMREPPQTRFVGRDQPHARFLRGVRELLHAAIAARLVVQHLRNRRRIVPHTCGHRMETVKNLQT